MNVENTSFAADAATIRVTDSKQMAPGTAALADPVRSDLPIRLCGSVDDSIVDGPGIRLALFTQGCARNCPGCHNPESQPYTGGYLVGSSDLMAMVYANPLLSGVTLSGGEPFDQAEALLSFVLCLRAEKPSLTVWAYSGYQFDELLADVPSEAAHNLLELTDVLVDGPFIESLRSLELKWRGSTNQRVIDVKATLSAEKVILFE